jgi:hypothetical protein
MLFELYRLYAQLSIQKKLRFLPQSICPQQVVTKQLNSVSISLAQNQKLCRQCIDRGRWLKFHSILERLQIDAHSRIDPQYIAPFAQSSGNL